MLLNWRRLLRVPWTARRSNESILKEISPSVHWKSWCWSWNSNTLATWCKKLTHWKRPWCWERLRAGGEGDNRGWDGWMASPAQWTWVWVNSGGWWWTGGPDMLQSMALCIRWPKCWSGKTWEICKPWWWGRKADVRLLHFTLGQSTQCSFSIF